MCKHHVPCTPSAGEAAQEFALPIQLCNFPTFCTSKGLVCNDMTLRCWKMFAGTHYSNAMSVVQHVQCLDGVAGVHAQVC
jgi:hypothetical protein